MARLQTFRNFVLTSKNKLAKNTLIKDSNISTPSPTQTLALP